MAYRSSARKSAAVAALLLVIYGFHLMGALVGLGVVTMFAFFNAEGRMRRMRLIALDMLATLPTLALCVFFVLQKGANIATSSMTYHGVLGQVKAYFGYNIWPLALHAGWILGMGLALFGMAAIVQAVQGSRYRDPALWTATLLVVAGVAMPISSGAAFVIGSRTLPFAIIMALTWFRFSRRGLMLAVAGAAGVVCASSILNTQAALAVQPHYRTFLSGLQTVARGSKIISIIPDLAADGNQYIQPFAGMEDSYNIYRGGSNGYALAAPYVRTGASALRLKYAPKYTYKYAKGVTPDYHGVGNVYDYALVYGDPSSVTAVLQAEMTPVFHNGALTIYKSRRLPPNP
jgi:hypothetical protein